MLVLVSTWEASALAIIKGSIYVGWRVATDAWVIIPIAQTIFYTFDVQTSIQLSSFLQARPIESFAYNNGGSRLPHAPSQQPNARNLNGILVLFSTLLEITIEVRLTLHPCQKEILPEMVAPASTIVQEKNYT